MKSSKRFLCQLYPGVADGERIATEVRLFSDFPAQITLDTYGHLFPALDDALTVGLEEQFQAARMDSPRPVRGLDEYRRSA